MRKREPGLKNVNEKRNTVTEASEIKLDPTGSTQE